MRPGNPAFAQGNGRYSVAQAADRVALGRSQGRPGPGGTRVAGGESPDQAPGGGNRGGAAADPEIPRAAAPDQEQRRYKALGEGNRDAQKAIRGLEDQNWRRWKPSRPPSGGGEPAVVAGERTVRVDEELKTFAERNAGLGEELKRKEEERRQLAAENRSDLAGPLRAALRQTALRAPSPSWNTCAPAAAA